MRLKYVTNIDYMYMCNDYVSIESAQNSSNTTISHTSAATFHSAFTSVIGWRTDMHKARFFQHKVEWKSAWTDIVSPKYNVYHYFQEENPMVRPALFAYAICLYQITRFKVISS